MDIVVVRTVDGSLLDRLLLATLLGSRRRLLVVVTWAGDALLASGPLGCSSSDSTSSSLGLATSFLDLLEAIGERNLQAVDGGASEIGGSFLPVNLRVLAMAEFKGIRIH
jgi:hypothetical protein